MMLRPASRWARRCPVTFSTPLCHQQLRGRLENSVLTDSYRQSCCRSRVRFSPLLQPKAAFQTRTLRGLQPAIAYHSWLLGNVTYRRRLLSTASGGEKEQKKKEGVATGDTLSQSTGTRFEAGEDITTPPVDKASYLHPVLHSAGEDGCHRILW